MTGYIGRLAARSLNKIDAIWPRTASIFEPQSPGGGYISRLAAVQEVRGDVHMPEETSSRRRSGPPQDMPAQPSEDEPEPLKISLERSSIQPSADPSCRADSQEPSTGTLRSHSTFEQEIQPTGSAEEMIEGYLSGDDSFRESARESGASALKKESEEPSARKLRSHTTFEQEVQPTRSAEETSDICLSGDASFREPARKDHIGTRMRVPEVLPEAVSRAKTRSTIAETTSSRHILSPSALKLRVLDERNEPIFQDVDPRRRRISAMFGTAGVQSKDESLGTKSLAHGSSSPESYPSIHVTIGRVEVKASQKSNLPEKRNNLGRIMSLEEYLARPRGRG